MNLGAQLTTESASDEIHTTENEHQRIHHRQKRQCSGVQSLMSLRQRRRGQRHPTGLRRRLPELWPTNTYGGFRATAASSFSSSPSTSDTDRAGTVPVSGAARWSYRSVFARSAMGATTASHLKECCEAILEYDRQRSLSRDDCFEFAVADVYASTVHVGSLRTWQICLALDTSSAIRSTVSARIGATSVFAGMLSRCCPGLRKQANQGNPRNGAGGRESVACISREKCSETHSR